MKRLGLIIIFLFSLAFLVRVGFLVYEFKLGTFQTTPYIPTSDRRDYDSAAIDLLNGYGYKTPDLLDTYRPPFYPLTLTFIYAFFGHSYQPVLAVQAILSSLAVVLIFLIGKKIFNPAVGFLAAIMTSFYWPFVTTVADLELENLLIFMPILFIYALLQIDKKSRWPIKVITGILLGLTVLTKGIFLLVDIGLTFLALSRKNLVIVILASALALTPWLVRNYSLYRQWFYSVQQGVALYGNTHPQFRAYNRQVHRMFVWDRTDLNEAQKNTYYTQLAFNNIKHHPLIYLNRVKDNWLELLDLKNFPNWFHLLLLAALVGMVLAWRRKKPAALILASFFWLINLQYALILGLPRFRMPFDWALIIFAAYAILSFIKPKKLTLWLNQAGWSRGNKLVPAVGKIAFASAVTLAAILVIKIGRAYLAPKTAVYASLDEPLSYLEVLNYQTGHRGSIDPFLGKGVVWQGEVSYLYNNSVYPLGSAKHPNQSTDPEYRGFYDIYYLPSTHFSTFNLTVNRGIKPGYYGDGVVMVNYQGSLLDKLNNNDRVAVRGKIIGQNFFGQVYLEAEEIFN